MKQASENRFSQGKVEESVTIKNQDVDRTRNDFCNIIGVMLSGISTIYNYSNKLVRKINLLWIYFNNQ